MTVATDSQPVVRPPWISRRWFLAAVAAAQLIGDALDLIGTRLAQPHLEHESNWIYVTLTAHGITPGWTAVIAGKAVLVVVFTWLMHVFLARRRAYYPDTRGGFRDFVSSFLFQRSLSWTEMLYRMPRWRPALLLAGAVVALSGPYYAYLGYVNLAWSHGWWRLPGFSVGAYWVDWAPLGWYILALAWLFRQLWVDYRSIVDAAARAEPV